MILVQLLDADELTRMKRELALPEKNMSHVLMLFSLQEGSSSFCFSNFLCHFLF